MSVRPSVPIVIRLAAGLLLIIHTVLEAVQRRLDENQSVLGIRSEQADAYIGCGQRQSMEH